MVAQLARPPCLLAATAAGATYHYGDVFIVDAVVVDWGLQEVPVFLQPMIDFSCRWIHGCPKSNDETHHLGILTGGASIVFRVTQS